MILIMRKITVYCRSWCWSSLEAGGSPGHVTGKVCVAVSELIPAWQGDMEIMARTEKLSCIVLHDVENLK